MNVGVHRFFWIAVSGFLVYNPSSGIARSKDSSIFSFLRNFPIILLLRYYSKNLETPIHKNLCNPIFMAAQFIVAKCWKQPKCPSVNEWIKKLWYIYTMEYYTEKRKELLPFATAWMELESIMLSEISQVVKDKYHIISPISGI